MPLAIVLAYRFAGLTNELAAFRTRFAFGTFLGFGFAAFKYSPGIVQTNLNGVVIAPCAVVEAQSGCAGMCSVTAQKAINCLFGCGQFTAIRIGFDITLTRYEARAFARIDAVFADFGFTCPTAGNTNHIGGRTIDHLPGILSTLLEDIAFTLYGTLVTFGCDALALKTVADGIFSTHHRIDPDTVHALVELLTFALDFSGGAVRLRHGGIRRGSRTGSRRFGGRGT